jgi:hypothetical protein
MTSTVVSRIGAAVGLLACSLVILSGCAVLDPEAQTRAILRGQLADAIEGSQDTVWEFRHELLADAEATLPNVWGLADARPAFADPTFAVPPGSYTLIRLSQDSDGTDLTFLRPTSVSTGGGWWYSTTEAVTCYTLVIAADASQISTVPSDCADADGVDRTTFLTGDENPNFIALEELDVRLTVDDSDYLPRPCQCSSGGTCDCPGG